MTGAQDDLPGREDAADGDDAAWLAPLFLGPCGENGGMLENLLTGLVRDHVYWRRNFHPEDPPSIPATARERPGFREAAATLEQALFDLGRGLKRSAPMFSPRYIGHMTSDPLLPALLGQLVTTLYNPNNVAAAGAPVTLGLEIEVGQQLAAMLGMAPERDSAVKPFGHLTSGGTMANYEALWLLRAARLYPPALAAGLRTCGMAREMDLRVRRSGNPRLTDLDPWQLANLGLEETCELQAAFTSAAEDLSRPQCKRLLEAVAAERHEYLGSDFFAHHGIAAPVVIAPATAHYSWSKAMTLLGLGRKRLRLVPTDARMRMDAGALARTLEAARKSAEPVLAVIGILGTTEFGTIDPLHEIADLREYYAGRGLSFALHVDAAWGGYLATLVREPDGGIVSQAGIRRQFRYFPTTPVYRAIRALARADTVTVDPHKMGYVPVGAGALVARDRRLTAFVGERPPYIYDDADEDIDGHAGDRRIRELGDYILEGSKPGAAAAAVWLAHRTLPLDRRHFGRLCRQTIRANERLYDRLRELSMKLSGFCTLSVPVEPDTNLVCLALNPAGNTALAEANDFTRRIYRRMAIDSSQPVQTRQFVASHTSVRRASLGDSSAADFATAIGVCPSTFVSPVTDPERQADEVFLIRHTLMNPWLDVVQAGRSYIELYCDWLEGVLREACRT